MELISHSSVLKFTTLLHKRSLPKACYEICIPKSGSHSIALTCVYPLNFKIILCSLPHRKNLGLLCGEYLILNYRYYPWHCFLKETKSCILLKCLNKTCNSLFYFKNTQNKALIICKKERMMLLCIVYGCQITLILKKHL